MGIQVQALCPGFTYTEFHNQPAYAGYQVKARIPRMWWMSPAAVVEESLQALGRGRVVCISGVQNRLLVALARMGLSGLIFHTLASHFPHIDQEACHE